MEELVGGRAERSMSCIDRCTRQKGDGETGEGGVDRSEVQGNPPNCIQRLLQPPRHSNNCSITHVTSSNPVLHTNICDAKMTEKHVLVQKLRKKKSSRGTVTVILHPVIKIHEFVYVGDLHRF